ncbi:MAG: class I SAM-dependent methyltransferase [Desulfatibacillum sp.]|nr:class I SAM-dependent methyltransferase [Desulfatibacillum sp.]
MSLSLSIAESGFVPGPALSQGMRLTGKKRLCHEAQGDVHARQRNKMSLIRKMDKSPVVLNNTNLGDHPFQVPLEFYRHVLGPAMLFSCCHFSEEENSLEKAEKTMLKLICKRADIRDGQRILDLECGWGGLSLYMAKKFPRTDIIAVTSSCPQKEYLKAKVKALGLTNLHPVIVDIKNFAPRGLFDRVVSIELFNHIRNWRNMLSRISQWLEPKGNLFLQMYCHRHFAYTFDGPGPKDYMARYFFPCSMMPSSDLLLYFQDRLLVNEHWRVSGAQYQKTARAWAANMRTNKAEIMGIMDNVYGKDRGKLWFLRWKNFFLACESLWGYGQGKEWMVSHYRMNLR